jgi:hypothetical protein
MIILILKIFKYPEPTVLSFYFFFRNYLFIYDIPHVSIGTLAAENLDVCATCDPWNSNIQLTMGIDWRRQIYPNVVQCLTLTLVDCDRKCHSNRKLTTMQNKWPISPGGGHDDAGYEYTFTNIIPCDDLCFNDTLTQSLDN